MKTNFHLVRLLCFAMLAISSLALAQTGIKIHYYTGSTQLFNIQENGKIYFSSDNLVVLPSKGASETTIPTTLIKKVEFTTEVLASQQNELSKNKFVLYPNPTSDYIKISTQDKKNKFEVKIYSTAGNLLYKATHQSDESISVAKLPTGNYVVNVNGETLKLIKK